MKNHYSNTIPFSFEMQDFGDHLTFEETFMQTRFYLVHLLNLIATGKTRLTESSEKSLRTYNRYCHMVGHEPLQLQ